MNILALDLAKFNTMCCFFDSVTRQHRFLTAATNPDYLTQGNRTIFPLNLR